jgi:pSer/pThr/pTyr-binding forkhead associated (FHA) protein
MGGGPAPSPPFGGPPPGAPPVVPAPPAAAATRPCPNCGFEVPTNFMFCGACGQKLTPVAARAGTGGTLQPNTVPDVRPRGRLTLIRPDGTEGGTLDLEEGENKIGRQSGPLFENDGYLSPLHAELVINAAGAVVHDSDSLNGVFVKITGEEELNPGDTFRIGQELIRFDIIAAPAPLQDGTEIMGSPNPGYWGRLSVIIGKDIEGSAFPLLGDAITMGRERGDINFPDDGYVSGLHARLTQRGGKFYLNDLGSSNGTFLKIRGERNVQNGSFVLLGQQLFRLNLS